MKFFKKWIQNWTRMAAGEGVNRWKMFKAFGVFYIPVLVVRLIISYPDYYFFLTIWWYVDSVCATVLLKCSYFNSEALRKTVGRDFLSQTVIMQLVFECSYDTNVYHLQSCVPGFFFFSVQYNSFHFTFY